MMLYLLMSILTFLVFSKYLYSKVIQDSKAHGLQRKMVTEDKIMTLMISILVGGIWPLSLLILFVILLGNWWLNFNFKTFIPSRISSNIEKNDKKETE